MPPLAIVESHEVDPSEPSFTPFPRQHGSSGALVCQSASPTSSSTVVHRRLRLDPEHNTSSTGSMVLTASPKAVPPSVIVREPVLPGDHQRLHSTRYAPDFLVPTGDRSTEDEMFASREDTMTQGDGEEEYYDDSVQQHLDSVDVVVPEVVPEVTGDDVDSELCSSAQLVPDIHTRTFPLQSSGSADALGAAIMMAATGDTAQLDQLSFTTSMPQLAEHTHIEINMDTIKSASLPELVEGQPVLPRINTAKTNVVCLSSDYQLVKNRGRNKQPHSPSSNLQALKRVWSGPLPMTRNMEERIETLGAALPNSQKAVLWTGIFLDIFTKLSILRQMGKFADTGDWTAFCIALTFFIFSGGCVAVYWWSHYPVEVLEAPGSPVRRNNSGVRLLNSVPSKDPASVRVYGVSKTDVKRIIRAIGAICAAFQLGTAFLAFRALFSSETRQRTVAYDLRGMRLVDTVFLTLILCLMQFFIGIRCTDPHASCAPEQGFGLWLIISIIASLCGSALSYTALDFNDVRIEYDRRHQIETLMFFLARVVELAARVQLLALFAAVMQGQFFTVVCGHMVVVLLALYLCPHPRRSLVWKKFATTTEFKIGRLRLHVPQANDIKLLVACMAWPPSCFVSDATGRTGRFWWRDRMVARRPFWSLTLGNALIPWPVYVTIMVGEAAAMMGVLYPMVQRRGRAAWAQPHFMIAIVLHMAWLFMASIWAATVHMAAAAASPEDISRALARKQLETLKDVERLEKQAARNQVVDIDLKHKSSTTAVLAQVQDDGQDTGAAADFQELRGGYSTLPQHYKLPIVAPLGAGPSSGLVPRVPSARGKAPALETHAEGDDRAGLSPECSRQDLEQGAAPGSRQDASVKPGLTMEAFGRIRFMRDSV